MGNYTYLKKPAPYTQDTVLRDPLYSLQTEPIYCICRERGILAGHKNSYKSAPPVLYLSNPFYPENLYGGFPIFKTQYGY